MRQRRLRRWRGKCKYVVSLVVIIVYLIPFWIMSFVNSSIEERGGGVKGGGDAAAEHFGGALLFFGIYERNLPFLFILFHNRMMMTRSDMRRRRKRWWHSGGGSGNREGGCLGIMWVLNYICLFTLFTSFIILDVFLIRFVSFVRRRMQRRRRTAEEEGKPRESFVSTILFYIIHFCF